MSMETELAEHNRKKEQRREHLREVTKQNVRDAKRRKFVQGIKAPFEKMGKRIEEKKEEKKKAKLRAQEKELSEQQQKERVEGQIRERFESYEAEWNDAVKKGVRGFSKHPDGEAGKCIKTVVYLKGGPLVRRDWIIGGEIRATEVYGLFKDSEGFVTFKHTKFEHYPTHIGDMPVEFYHGYTGEFEPKSGKITWRAAAHHGDLTEETNGLVSRFDNALKKAMDAEKEYQLGE